MKQTLSLFTLLLLSMASLAGCGAVIGDIFKAGVWVGVLLVLAVIGVVVWAISKSA